ncbi:hypothetical protein ES703_85512 [subsurface metagenome]
MVALVLGALILFPLGSPVFSVNPWLIATLTLVIAIIFVFVLSHIIRAHRRQPATGREELIGKRAVVKAALEPEGTVLFKGELWTAISETGSVKLGETVFITKVDGLILYVKKQ